MGLGRASNATLGNERASAHFRLDAGWCRAPRNEEVRSMDRHNRVLVGGSLAVLLGFLITGSGCRSMRNDVPPGKPYSTTGGSPPPLGFNSDPHPNTSVGGGMYGGGMTPGSSSPNGGPTGPGGMPQLGTPTPGTGPYGAPTVEPLWSAFGDREPGAAQSVIMTVLDPTPAT